ncbi:MAG: hypothetical protein V1837_02910 [Candidatus Woesearchaeota archaeon]
MPSYYGRGAVYNWYLSKQMDIPSPDLQRVIEKWDNKSLIGKVLYAINLFSGKELEIIVARDILDARDDPQGETAQKINWKIEEYRKEKKEKRMSVSEYLRSFFGG